MFQGRIYKIISPQTEKVYVGSTTDSINQRFSKHKCDYKRYQDGKGKYITSYEILKHGDAVIELIEEKRYENRNNMIQREMFYIGSVENTVNKMRPKTSEERAKRYKEIREHQKQYTKERKEKVINITFNITVNDSEVKIITNGDETR